MQHEQVSTELGLFSCILTIPLSGEPLRYLEMSNNRRWNASETFYGLR